MVLTVFNLSLKFATAPNVLNGFKRPIWALWHTYVSLKFSYSQQTCAKLELNQLIMSFFHFLLLCWGLWKLHNDMKNLDLMKNFTLPVTSSSLSIVHIFIDLIFLIWNWKTQQSLHTVGLFTLKAYVVKIYKKQNKANLTNNSILQTSKILIYTISFALIWFY